MALRDARFARNATVLGGSRGRSRIHGEGALSAVRDPRCRECRHHAKAKQCAIVRSLDAAVVVHAKENPPAERVCKRRNSCAELRPAWGLTLTFDEVVLTVADQRSQSILAQLRQRHPSKARRRHDTSLRLAAAYAARSAVAPPRASAKESPPRAVSAARVAQGRLALCAMSTTARSRPGSSSTGEWGHRGRSLRCGTWSGRWRWVSRPCGRPRASLRPAR
jgi:hypothetical protein